MKVYINSLIIALAIIVTAVIVTNAYKNRNRTNNTISVTGLGEKEFVSDLIVWDGVFLRKNMDLKQAYAELNKDREVIKSYLVSKGVKEESIIFSSISIDKEFDHIEEGSYRTRTVFAGYKLQQAIQIESKEVDKIENISREVSELINSGVEFYSNSPEYYYTKLAELKIAMIAEATKDANVRAARIAENSGGGLGELKKADMGVFQIVAQNSSEEYSWGGAYNTSSKRKKASITVSLEYETK